MPRIDAPAGIEGAAARVSESSARAFADSVQSQCLSTVSSAGRMTPVAAAWTSTSSVPSAATSSAMLGGDVPAKEDWLDAELRQLRSRVLSGLVSAHVADGDTACAEGRETEGDRLPDPARSSGRPKRSKLIGREPADRGVGNREVPTLSGSRGTLGCARREFALRIPVAHETWFPTRTRAGGER